MILFLEVSSTHNKWEKSFLQILTQLQMNILCSSRLSCQWVRACIYVYVYMCACIRVCVRGCMRSTHCVRACVNAWVRENVRACVCVSESIFSKRVFLFKVNFPKVYLRTAYFPKICFQMHVFHRDMIWKCGGVVLNLFYGHELPTQYALWYIFDATSQPDHAK